MKKAVVLLMVIFSVFVIISCRQDAPGGEFQLDKKFDFDNVSQIILVNAHNGYSTTITDKNDIEAITSFVGKTIAKEIGSGKGYYEGSYSVTILYQNGEEFSLGYGDDNVFYMGKGKDGYPVRYRLTNITISDDVIPFFSRYDHSYTERNGTD